MDSDERRLFEAGVRRAMEQRSRADLDAALTDLGWVDALRDDPAIAAVVFAAHGELNASSSALDDVLLAGLGLAPAPTTAVVLTDASPETRGTVEIRGLATRRMAGGAKEAVIAVADGTVRLAPAASLSVRAVGGIDPAGGWVEVSGEVSDSKTIHGADWAAALRLGRLAIASELAGASRAMLRLARDHAVDRVQFGRPIASFQAVRHRLADALIAVESADVAAAAGWSEGTDFAATMAKVIAGRGARTVARHAQQVLAGMGFTDEHAFHLYFKRTLVLDHLLGASAALSAEVGADILRSRTVPELLPL